MIRKHIVLFGDKINVNKCYATQSVQAPTLRENQRNSPNVAAFDTDSVEVKIDTGCSISISGNREDFVPGSLQVSRKDVFITGYGGNKVRVAYTGTIRWPVIDDAGALRELRLPNSLYTPSSKTRLLSPQHLAQVSDNSSTPTHLETRATAYSDKMTLQWGPNGHIKTVSLDSSNLGTIHTASGFTKSKRFHAKYAEHNSKHIIEEPYLCFECTDNTIAHMDDGLLSYDATVRKGNEKEQSILSKGTLMELPEKLRESGVLGEIDVSMFKNTKQGIESLQETYSDIRKDEDLMMVMHHKFGHIPFKRIVRMAEMGLLPKRLAKCAIPPYQSCIYGKLTRRPWRTKPLTLPSATKVVTWPGQVVSVDQ